MSLSTPATLFDYARYEPNWLRVEEVGSYLEEGRYGTVAFLCRWGYKAAETRDNSMDWDWLCDWELAFDAGYLLHDPPYMNDEGPVTKRSLR